MRLTKTILFKLALMLPVIFATAQSPVVWKYTVSIPSPESHSYKVSLDIPPLNEDTLRMVMPVWTPGYYQYINYASTLKNLVMLEKTKNVRISSPLGNVWMLTGLRGKPIRLTYEIHTTDKFVAKSYVDEHHAYLVGANSFLYPEGRLDDLVQIKLEAPDSWEFATGLSVRPNEHRVFDAANFDIVYDCPILIGKLEELPSFDVNGVNHRFIGYQMKPFDHVAFIDKLKKVVEASIGVIGHTPYSDYTFIAIGPGFGGIEHLNNTTVSFDGTRLTSEEELDRVLAFLAHEHFHSYNVKRIRPFELGPFNYESGSRTNQLWVSEGITVYYEYLIMKRAGLYSAEQVVREIETHINLLQSNPGRQVQSLQQASFSTWEDGPFGKNEETLSIYNKGFLVAFILDVAIREKTQSHKSLDDVMRACYQKYYQQMNRGFTEAEFQQMCEQIAGESLSQVFEYVYTTRELDYAKYLGICGLELTCENAGFRIRTRKDMTALQAEFESRWLGD